MVLKTTCNNIIFFTDLNVVGRIREQIPVGNQRRPDLYNSAKVKGT